MRENLIECLKFCAEDDSDCRECPRWNYDCGSSKCVNDLLLTAAIALKEMQAISDKTSGDPMTNGDKIRAMDDETLARQLLSVINEAVAAMTGERLPDEISDVFEGQLLAKLKLPVEEHNDRQRKAN